MILQLKERQDESAAAPVQAKEAAQEQAQPTSDLRSMSFEQGQEKLAPGAEANANAQEKPAAADKGGDDGGPGTTVTRYEQPSSRVKKVSAVKVSMKDEQSVDENQNGNLHVDAVDPDAPGQTSQLWFEWKETGGPKWLNTSGMYKQDFGFQAPEVEKDDVITGEVTVTKRGFVAPKGVATTKPFSMKVKNVEKPAPAPTSNEAEKPGATKDDGEQQAAQKPGEVKKPGQDDMEAMLLALLKGMAGPKKEEDPPAPAPVPKKADPAPTPSPKAETSTETEAPKAPVPEKKAAPHHHKHKHHHHKHRHHHHHKHKHHKHGHHHHKHAHHHHHGHHGHHHHKHRGELHHILAHIRHWMDELGKLAQPGGGMPHNNEPVKPPKVPRPPVLPPAKPPIVSAPAPKSLQAGERGRLEAKVVDPDQGALGGPRVEWRQQKGPKLEALAGQGTNAIEFTAPKTNARVQSVGVVHATDAQGLHAEAQYTVNIEPTIAANETGKVWGDPHFVGGDGGKYDIMGKPGGVYNLLSDSGVRVTALFKQYTKQGVTVMDKCGATLTGKTAKGVGSNQIEFRPGVALIDGKAVPKGKMVPTADGGSLLYMGDQLIVDTREGYKITFFQRTSSGINYVDCDVQTGARGVGAGGDPDGLLGQTFDADNKAKNGKTGANAQGEGAIAGKVTDYEVAGGIFGKGTGAHSKGGLDANVDDQRLVRRTVLVNANPGAGAEGYVDASVDVQKGDKILIAAKGSATEHGNKLNRTPAGDAGYKHPQKSNFMSASAPAFALVGRVGSDKSGFMVGTSYQGQASKDGKLQLAFNDLRGTFGDNSGYYLADVQIVRAKM
ncbi:MAG: hypothetical protein KC635_20015 [Myxococcales bacterium]|nr:hypothetical protein [Myxococcales bacterium]MCB9737346.1 hypothetical protein [Deltaproteobacteria bacterium]